LLEKVWPILLDMSAS